jgi:hypothetical protein
MTKKIILFSAGLFAIMLVAVALPLSAKNTDNNGNPPEVSGIYDVPGHSNLKLRVFVHEPKPARSGKPSPTPVPAVETCVDGLTADQDSLAVVPGAGWKLPSSWAYRLNASSVPSSVGGANLQTIASNAFSAWQGAIVPGSVAISRGTDTSVGKAVLDGQNIISWGRTSGTALAVSYIWYDSATGIAKEIDTIFNNKFKWEWSDPSSWAAGQMCYFGAYYDAQEILTHELGHTMGLDDVYTAEYVNNTMYGYGATGETKKDTLTTGDVLGVSALY